MNDVKVLKLQPLLLLSERCIAFFITKQRSPYIHIEKVKEHFKPYFKVLEIPITRSLAILNF